MEDINCTLSSLLLAASRKLLCTTTQYYCPLDMNLLLKTITLWGVVILCDHVDSYSDEEWSYKGNDNGPEYWGERYPTCFGQEQSPINVPKRPSDSNFAMKNLRLSKCYSDPQTFTLENNGDALVVLPGDKSSCSVSGDLVGNNYTFLRVAFHWGLSNNSRDGSEHSINDKKYVMEAQFLHSLNDDEKYVQFSIFFEISQTDNAALEPIIKAFEGVRTAETQTSGSGLVLAKFFTFPLRPLVDVMRYTGSFTTPGCQEGVVWYIIAAPKTISMSQLKKFQSLKDKHDNELGGNTRPTQPINDRKIDYYQVSFRTGRSLL